jgi:DNA-binding CsgD family transcriptional regulator
MTSSPAAEKTDGSPPEPCSKVLVSLARAIHAPLCVMGDISLSDLRLQELSCAGPLSVRPAAVNDAVEQILRTVEGTLGQQAAPVGDAGPDVEFSAEQWSEGAIVWLSSERCIVGIWRNRTATVTPFVAVILDRAGQVFPRWQRDLMRMALIHQTERLSWKTAAEPALTGSALCEVVVRSIGVGLAVVDSLGRVLLSNGFAEIWFAESDAIALTAGRLTARRPEINLAKALLRATGPQRQPAIVALPPADGRGPAGLLTFVPVNHGKPHALVICGSWAPDGGISDLVFEALGLTVAERRLACLLVVGHSLEEAAGQTNVTVSTARSYLKRIFTKIGVRRQSELVAYMQGATPPLHLKQLRAGPVRDGARSSDRGK